MNSKNIVITGASQGIGFQTAKLLCKQGHNVFGIARNHQKLEMLQNECSKHDGKFTPIALNLEEFDKSILDEIITSVQYIDVLINNAGRLLNKNFLEITEQEIHNVLNLNYVSVIKTIQYFHPLLKKSENPHIVNISSVGGVTGSVKFSGLSVYSSSKGALSILSECLAKDFEEDNIKVNCLALGAVNTQMLQEAFPDYQAQVSPKQMAKYISHFALNSHSVVNGTTQIISTTNP